MGELAICLLRLLALCTSTPTLVIIEIFGACHYPMAFLEYVWFWYFNDACLPYTPVTITGSSFPLFLWYHLTWCHYKKVIYQKHLVGHNTPPVTLRSPVQHVSVACILLQNQSSVVTFVIMSVLSKNSKAARYLLAPYMADTVSTMCSFCIRYLTKKVAHKNPYYWSYLVDLTDPLKGVFVGPPVALG